MAYEKPKSSFYSDLKKGQDGEKKFFEKYGEFLEATDGRQGDFKIKGTELKIELKCDSYSHDKWTNFVLERWSRPGKPGGPFQSLEHGCKYFAYYFINDDKLYLFETLRLVKRIEALVRKKGFKLESRANIGYTTEYYRMPRAEFEDLMLHWHTTIERKYKVAQRKAKK
jgi:hypothetical protein